MIRKKKRAHVSPFVRCFSAEFGENQEYQCPIILFIYLFIPPRKVKSFLSTLTRQELKAVLSTKENSAFKIPALLSMGRPVGFFCFCAQLSLL